MKDYFLHIQQLSLSNPVLYTFIVLSVVIAHVPINVSSMKSISSFCIYFKINKWKYMLMPESLCVDLTTML